MKKAIEDFSNLMKKHAHMHYLVPLTLGLCIPSGCSKDELSQILISQAKKVPVMAEVTRCEIKSNEVHFTLGQICAIAVSCMLGTLVLLGTFLERRSKSKNTTCTHLGSRILLSFSVINNFKKLTSTKTSMDRFNCLHGIRFLTITWVVLAHTYFYPGCFLSRYRMLFRSYDFASETFTQMMTNGSECVDTFLFMGGMLLSYFTIKHVKIDKKRFDIGGFILHRLWRIMPVYYFIILFGCLVPLMGSGPLFHETMVDSIYPCFQYWWRNILFINNYYPMKDMCMLHTWYVSCDMQLYLVSILVLLAFLRSEKLGVVISVFIILLSIVYSGVVTYAYDLMPTLTVAYTDPDDRQMFFFYTYANTLSRAGPYFIGILFGYMMIKKPDLYVSRNIQMICWCVAAGACGCVIFITSAWFKVYTPSTFQLVIYASLYKIAFTLGIAWMTFCCMTGRGGFINEFLSWKLWVPLSKLTFLIYLIHPYLQNVFIANFKKVHEVNHIFFIIEYFGYLSISSLLAFVASFLIESPFVAMEKILFRRGEKKAENINVAKINGFRNGELSLQINDDLDKTLHEKGVNHAFQDDEVSVKVNGDLDKTIHGNGINTNYNKIYDSKL
ncbi:nose resistant to fluoxetine protein 6 [Nephila pilipes]|uniref:Nose resistant to fluoxetine protein 6 n=1 Tax=Nephila pilipes TaxID=299642 RepID=A0A8X6NGJ5_NEPPI|nr:nose resistant to fluoxetine protein 6 [Nephila pilipes]